MRQWLLLIVFLSFLLSGCFLSEDGTDVPFFERNLGYDIWSIPLIEPCFLGSTTGINGTWHVTNNAGNNRGTEVNYINVLDSIIISYHGEDFLKPENNDTTWYIHIPSSQLEYKFNSEDKFNEKVVELTNEEIEFFEVTELYNELIETGYLEWYPDEYKE